MTGEPGAREPHPSTGEHAQRQDAPDIGELEREAILTWVGQHLTLVRRSAAGQRVFYWILGIGFVLGLAAHAGGFLLKTWVTTEPLLLMADLLYALGWALWTSVIVVLFVEIWPEAKKRQYQRVLDAYEEAVGRQVRAGSRQVPDPASDDDA